MWSRLWNCCLAYRYKHRRNILPPTLKMLPHVPHYAIINCNNATCDVYIFVNCNWVDSRWQWYSTHLHTNNTQNNTINNQTIRITNKTQTTNLEECWPCPVFVFYPGICLTTEEKARKNLSHGANVHKNKSHSLLRVG
jgi:hypothetical protein